MLLPLLPRIRSRNSRRGGGKGSVKACILNALPFFFYGSYLSLFSFLFSKNWRPASHWHVDRFFYGSQKTAKTRWPSFFKSNPRQVSPSTRVRTTTRRVERQRLMEILASGLDTLIPTLRPQILLHIPPHCQRMSR